MDTKHQQETRISVTKADIEKAEAHWKHYNFIDDSHIRPGSPNTKKIIWLDSKEIFNMEYDAFQELDLQLENTMHIVLARILFKLVKLAPGMKSFHKGARAPISENVPSYTRIMIPNVFNVKIDIAFQPTANLQKVKLATPNDVVCTLSGKDARFCYYVLRGNLYKALRYFPEGLDNSLLLMEAFNHPTVPVFSHVAKESIPKIIDYLFAPGNALVHFLELSKQQNCYVGKLYNHLQKLRAMPAGNPAGYSDIGKLIIILVLLNGCKEFMSFSGSDANEQFKKLHESIEQFLKILVADTYVEDAFNDLLDKMVKGVSKSLPIKKFDATFKQSIENLATYINTTPLKVLLSKENLSRNLSLHLPKMYTLKEYRILNWNLENAPGIQTDYEQVAKFIFNMMRALPANQQPDFFTFQNVADPVLFNDYLNQYFPGQYTKICLNAQCLMSNEKWLMTEYEESLSPMTVFFEDQQGEKKVQIRNFNRIAEPGFRDSIDAMAESTVDYTGDICSIGYFNHPIPLQSARCIDSTSNYIVRGDQTILPILQKISREGCFELSSTGGLTQVSGQPLDTLNPGNFLRRFLLPRNVVLRDSEFTAVYSPQQYPICLFNEAKKEYGMISVDEFMRRLEKVIGYDVLVAQVKKEKPQLKHLMVSQLSINAYGLIQLKIQLRHDLPQKIRDQLIENLQCIGAILPAVPNPDHCTLTIMPLAQQEERWKKLENPLTLNFAHIKRQVGTRVKCSPLYLPSPVINRCLNDLDRIRKGSALTLQQRAELDIVFKAMEKKGGLDGWLQIEADCMAWEKSRPIVTILGKIKNKFNFFVSNEEEPKYDDTDGLLLALAHSYENMVKNPEIYNVKTLVVADQIRRLHAFFDSEIKRLKPDMEDINAPGYRSSNASNAKIAAYQMLKAHADGHSLNKPIDGDTIREWNMTEVLVNGEFVYAEGSDRPQLIGEVIKSSRGSIGFGHPESDSSINFEATVPPITRAWNANMWRDTLVVCDPYAKPATPSMNFSG